MTRRILKFEILLLNCWPFLLKVHKIVLELIFFYCYFTGIDTFTLLLYKELIFTVTVKKSHTHEIAGPSGLQNESDNNNKDQISINDDGDHSYCIPAGTPTISFNLKAREQRSASRLENQRQEMIEQIGDFNDKYAGHLCTQ